MNITVVTIPHDEQRYPTVGDWTFDGDGNLTVRVSDMGNWKYQALVAIHEIVEALACKDRGVHQVTVDAFDKAYAGDGEPGDDPRAPYYHQHRAATEIEMRLAKELGVDWVEYDEAVMAL